MKTSRSCSRGSTSRQSAFTLVELLAIIGVLVLVSLTLVPVLAQNRPQVSSARCLSNFRSLMGALQMYTEDNSGFLPPNPDDANGIQGHAWVSGMVGIGDSGEYDLDLLKDPTRNLLIKYLDQRINVFSCAADGRPSKPVTGTSMANTNYRGQFVRPPRSVSMSGAVGTACPGFASASAGHSGKPTLAVNGPWLDNAHGHRANSPYRTFAKLSAMTGQPKDLWVLIEEDYRSMNDGVFGFGMNTPEWIDFPAINHDSSAVIGFADGHGEMRKWVDARTRMGDSWNRVPVPGSLDYAWLAERTTSRAR